MKKLIILAFVAILGFQSCNFGTTGVWKDENIEQSLKNEIQELDKKVLEAVTTGNIKLLKSMMSDILLEKVKDSIDQLIDKTSNLIITTDYKILNQFQTRNSTTGLGNTVLSGMSGLNDYIIHYKALNKEMFISVLIVKGQVDDFTLTNIYGKYSDGWKLNILQFGQYNANGKTAPELYAKAKENYQNGYLTDAAINMFLSSEVANPANKFWKYQNEDEMREFYEEVMPEIKSKYKFPIILEAIESKPQILNVAPQITTEGYFPLVEYLTKLDLKDTTRTKEEYEKVHSEVIKVFNGIEREKKYIFYKAYNEIPNGKTSVPTYGFVKKLK